MSPLTKIKKPVLEFHYVLLNKAYRRPTFGTTLIDHINLTANQGYRQELPWLNIFEIKLVLWLCLKFV